MMMGELFLSSPKGDRGAGGYRGDKGDISVACWGRLKREKKRKRKGSKREICKEEEGERLRKRRTERDFDLGKKTEDTIRSHFRVDNEQVSECYAFEISFHVLFHLAIHILMILLCYYLSKNWYFAYWCMR